MDIDGDKLIAWLEKEIQDCEESASGSTTDVARVLKERAVTLRIVRSRVSKGHFRKEKRMLDYPTVDAVADAVARWLTEPEHAEVFRDEELVDFIRSLKA